MRASLALSRWALLAVACLLPAPAAAHGRPPFVGQIAFHPTDPDMIVARGTFGLVVTYDHGETWSWVCAAVLDADPTVEDPRIVVMPDGSILAATFKGVIRGEPDLCEWSHPDPQLDDVFVIDLAVGEEPSTVYAVYTDGFEPDQLYRSTDMGHSFTPVGPPIEDILLERVLIAPSDEDRIYLSGAIPMSAGVLEREGYLLRSNDRGETFERIRIPFEDGERNVHLFAVDPTNPDRVLIRITRRISDMRDERLLLTEDAGETFTTVFGARDMSGAAFSPDGQEAYVSVHQLAGLFHSADAGLTFQPVIEGSFYDVRVRDLPSGREVVFARDEVRDPYSLGRSFDAGATVEEILHFPDIGRLPPCSNCTETGVVCPEWFPDLATDLALDVAVRVDGGLTGAPRDAGVPGACDDGGVNLFRDAGSGEPPPGGCGCRIGGRQDDDLPGAPGALLALGLTAVRLTRRRRAPYVPARRLER